MIKRCVVLLRDKLQGLAWQSIRHCETFAKRKAKQSICCVLAFVCVDCNAALAMTTFCVIARSQRDFVAIQSVIANNSELIYNKSSYKSFQVGLKLLINSSFFFLLPAFICFSLIIADSIFSNIS